MFEVLSTSGDTHLGGDDFDKRIVDFLADDFQKNEGIDLRKDRQVGLAVPRHQGLGNTAYLEFWCSAWCYATQVSNVRSAVTAGSLLLSILPTPFFRCLCLTSCWSALCRRCSG